MDFDFDEEWLIAMGFGVVCGFLVLIIFKMGSAVPLSIGVKLLGMVGGFITGTLLSKFIFSR